MKRKFFDLLRAKRAILLLLFYVAAITVSLYCAYEIRFDLLLAPEFQQERLRVLPVVLVIQLSALLFARQLGSMITFFGVPDFFRLCGALLSSALLLIVPRFFGYGRFSPPRGVLLIDFLLCLGILCSFRLSARLFRERVLMGKRMPGRALERIAIIGAGDAGASLAADLISMPARGFRPVAFLDDDRLKHKQFIHGVCVEGRPEDFMSIPALDGVMHAIIAMPSAPAKRVREIALYLGRHGVRVEIVPALEDLASGKAQVNQIRPIQVEDLLGRVQVDLDSNSIRNFIEGRTVMVTGAGGSIGSELCRQICSYNPGALVIVDRSEPSVFMIEQELVDLGMGALIHSTVADVSNHERMADVFSRFRPQVLFHAAAHKHVYLMERQPAEALRNNSFATRALAQMAAEYAVQTFVMISTDKAINPTSVMGASKRLAEIFLQALQANSSSRATKYIMVRFGNVLGSSGSVIPLFKKQIAAGGPVTVTHPEVTRYFMTIPEASGLVLQASVIGKGGEIFVLDMGQPVKIVDLAKQMIELSGFVPGEDIDIIFTGLKPGEKLYEELRHRDERHLPTIHSRIMQFMPNNDVSAASQLALQEIQPCLYQVSGDELKRRIRHAVPEYTPFFDQRS